MNDAAVSSQLSRLLDTALDLPAAERDAWIDTLDATHDNLKPRLRALLSRAADIESRNFLGSLPIVDSLEADEDGLDTQVMAAAGGRVGPYQLQRQLGAGGMGTVWLATRADGLFERSIALKLPHRGMFGVDLAERMARERGILAGLDHPNIARLHDAGLTTDGQPYLALEYVEGVAIDEYCRTRVCDLRERLRLFLMVADAVASAHARLVVHRDIKPANILVTHDGNVRLLDFGIAKLLDAPAQGDAPLTQLSVHAMTPDYASPEQIRGEQVTIASDVYSLGVVLFELLTGERPYRLRRGTRGALEEAILQCEPRRPSELPVADARVLRGDLDTIVLKALHKAPPERYATVNALADDLRRYLGGHPVMAQPDSVWYRASRFLRRHALASTLAALVTLTILTTAGVALWQAQVANEQRQRAEDVNRFIKSIFTSADPFQGGGRELRALELLHQARARVDRDFTARPAQRVELLNTIALSLCNLSDYATADEVSEAALALALRELPVDSAERREARLVRLEVHRFRGRNQQLRHEVDQLLAEAAKDRAFTTTDRIRLLTYSAHAAIDEGNPDVAAAQSGAAFALASRTLGDRDPLTLEVALTESVSLRFAGRIEDAARSTEGALQLALAAAGNNAASARVLDARMGLGSIYSELGRPTDAARELESVVAGATGIYGADSAFEMFAHSHLARAHYESGDLRAALANIDRTLQIAATQSDEEARNTGIATAIRGHILLASERYADALAAFETALPFYREQLGVEHVATLGIRIDRAIALAQLGRSTEALIEMRPIASGSAPIKHWMVVSPGYALGVVQRLAGQPQDALLTQRAALAELPAGPRRDFQRMAVLAEIGENALATGELAEAEQALRESLALHIALQSVATPARAAVQRKLERAREARGKAAS